MRQYSILRLVPLLETANELGFPAEALMRQHGIDLDNLTGEALINQQQELAIIKTAIEEVADPLFGLKVGSNTNLSAYGTYAMLTMSAENAKKACLAGIEFQQLSHTYSVILFETFEHYSELRYVLPEVAEPLKTFFADREFMGALKFVREMVSKEELQPLNYGVARPKPENLRDYQRITLVNAQFEQSYNWIRLPNRMLKTPMKHANLFAHKLYRAQAYEMMQKYFPQQENMAEQIKLSFAGYSNQLPNIKDSAARFNISERTLRRKLSELGTSYRQLLDEFRCSKAKVMLSQQQLPVNTVATILGYSDSVSFINAFKRWTGITPTAYKKQQTHPLQ